MDGDGVLGAVDAALDRHFGHRAQRASVSFVGVEPIEILRFDTGPDERAYVTLGMSRRPMTSADEAAMTPHGPRAELMLLVRDPGDHHADVWRQLAVLAAAPAVEGVVYVSGMTVDLGQVLTPDSRCSGVLVVDSALAPVPVDGGVVGIHQVLPLTANELAWARVHGSDALLERLRGEHCDLMDLDRVDVRLD